MADNFHVWLAKPHTWVKADNRAKGGWLYMGLPSPGDAPRKVAGPFDEPAEAADAAEDVLDRYGSPNQSYAEIRYNGDKQPHTILFLLEDEKGERSFGVWNTESARWPFFYPPGSASGISMEGWPEGFETNYDDPDSQDGETSGEDSGFGAEDENSEVMDLGGDGEDDAADEGDDDEGTGDDEGTDDQTDDEIDEGDDDDEADEDGEEETEEEDSGEVEEDEEDFEFHDGDDDSDGDDPSDSDEEAEEDGQDEEMPRLIIFAKMRGPKGWRKRAEAEELLERNVFALKVGVLNPDEELAAAKQEAELVAHVEFVESDDDRGAGLLKLKLPTGVTLEDFKQTKNGWITARVPYRRDDAEV